MAVNIQYIQYLHVFNKISYQYSSLFIIIMVSWLLFNIILLLMFYIIIVYIIY